MATPETVAKDLGITPQVLRRKLRALGLGHKKGERWSWDDASAELAALKEQLKSAPKVVKKPAAKKAKPAAKSAAAKKTAEKKLAAKKPTAREAAK